MRTAYQIRHGIRDEFDRRDQAYCDGWIGALCRLVTQALATDPARAALLLREASDLHDALDALVTATPVPRLPGWWRRKEAARVLARSESHVSDLCKRGDLACTKDGGDLFVEDGSLRALVVARGLGGNWAAVEK